jgi:hypothetical protein
VGSKRWSIIRNLPESGQTAWHPVFRERIFRFHSSGKVPNITGKQWILLPCREPNTPIRAYGFQAEIDRTQNTGGLYETGGRAWVARPDQQVIKERKYLPGEWSDLEIHAGGKNVSVLINGILSTELKKDPGRTKGFFGLQLHGGQDMHVEYKDIRLKNLDR